MKTKTPCTLNVLATLFSSALLLPPAATAATGDPDSFDPGPNGGLFSAVAQPDGKILLGGSFTAVKPIVQRIGIARYNAGGTLDSNFDPEPSGAVLFTAVQGDGKILLGGSFDSVGGVARVALARLNADNSLDTGFNPSIGNTPRGMALQVDGKIVLGGPFTNVNGIARLRLARVNADGTLDPGFDPACDGSVESIALRTDGRILVGGTFTTVGGIARTNIAQLNSDGTLDTGFVASAVAPDGAARVQVLAVQADGKILMGGSFTNVNGVARSRIARLNSDGTLDTSFTASANAPVDSLALQADGKILIGGAFTNVNGVARVYLARLNADGTLDATLNPPVAVGNGLLVESVALQADGKILLGGTFTSIGGLSRLYVARLENDAATQSLTASANRVEWLRGGTATEVQAVTFELSTNGGGSYISLGGGTRISGGWELTGLSLPIGGQIRARARTVGGSHNASISLVETVAMFGYQPELAVAGNGTDIVNGDSTPSVSDGTDFGANALALGAIVRTFTITNSGNTNLTLSNVVVSGANAGNFSVTTQPATTVGPGGSTTFQVTFTPDGYGLRSASLSFSNNDANENPFNFSIQATVVVSLDAGFNPNASGPVYATAVQPDGKILIGGEFGLARLKANGTPDTGFNPNVPYRVSALSVQPDGRILFGGIGGLARVNEDGTLDTGFNLSVDNPVWCIAQQPDGKILLGGSFFFVGGQVRTRVARVNTNGALDTGFDPRPNDIVYGIAVQPDGKILLGGKFTALQPNGGVTTNVSRIARLNADGTLDTGFANPAPDIPVLCLAVQANGKILAGGLFSTLGGLVRFNTDGTLDNGFNPAANLTVYSLALQADGKIVMGGRFTSVGGTTRNRAARLHADGTLDVAFDPNANNQIYSVDVQADGKVLLAGDFTSVGGGARNYLARMENETATQSLTVPTSSRVQWLRGGSSPESPWVTFELSTDGGTSYTPLGFGTRITGGWELTGLSLPQNGLIRARVQTHGGQDSGSSGLAETVLVFGTFTEIAVLGNGTNIVDGDSTPSVADGTDFGGVASASGTIVHTFTITNRGNLNLTLGNVTVGGAHAADFVVSAQPAAALLAPNGSTTFQVTFDPSVAGLRSATLSFTNNDSDENPFNFSIQGTGDTPEIAVTGNGLNIANGDSTPSLSDHTDFGGVAVTSGTIARTFTITNSGLASLTLGSVTVGGADAADFVASLQPAATVAANGNTTFQVTFDPSAGGLRNATLSFSNNDLDENPFSFSIQGTGMAPEIAVTGNGLNIADGDVTPASGDHTDFGIVNITGSALLRTFTITNRGVLSLTLGTVTVSGPNAADFVVNSQPGGSLGPNGSTTFQVTFDPSALGLRTATLSFTNNDSDENPFNFDIQGTGGAPEIVVTGNSLDIADGDSTPSLNDHTDFGALAAASGSVSRSFTITNIGDLTLTLGAVAVSGPHATDFVVSAQPALASLGPNESTTFQVTFDPSADGQRSATLSLTNNDSDENPFNFNIQGTGIAPEIAVGGNGLNIARGDVTPSLADHTDFGGVNVTGSTLVRTYTITNTGSLNLALGTVTIGGAHAADFAVTAQPAATVAPNGNTTFQVTFDPSALGVRSAILSFTNNTGSANPFAFNIQGTGSAPEIAVTGNGVNITDGDSTPSTADHTDFGTVTVASGSVVRTFTITNLGDIHLLLGSVAVVGNNAADFAVSVQPAPSVAPNGSTTFQVTFLPSAAGLRTAKLSFTNNDSDENPFDFNIQGTGTGAEIAVLGSVSKVNIADGDTVPDAADGTDFGSTDVTDSATFHSFIITNSGTLNLTLGPVTIGGPHAADFLVSAQPATNVVPHGITTFQVLFDPSALGLRTATLSFTNNDPDENPFDFKIQGTGVAAEVAVTGNGVEITDGDSTPSLTDHTDFGSVNVSNTLVRTFTITNSGTGTLTLGSVDVGGVDAARFVVSVQPAKTVAPNGSTTFQVTFAPITVGLRSATLTFGNNDSDEDLFDFNIQGTGAAPEIAVAGNGLEIVRGDATPSVADDTDFGGVNVIGGTLVHTFTITNSGNADLTLGNVTISGTHAADFAVSFQPAATVASGGSTPFQITFDPSGPGFRNATLSFTNNDSNENPFSFTIRGTGLAPEISVTGNSVDIADGDSTPNVADHTDFGGVNVTSSQLIRTFTIRNTGTTNLTLGSVTISGTHAADFAVILQPSATVALGGNTTFQITLDPSASGLRTATVSFTNNDSDENPFNFNIQGTGLGPEIAVTGNGVNITNDDSTPDLADHTDFGGVSVTDGTLVRTFTITNLGNTNLTLGTVTLVGGQAADFAVSAQPAATVGANGSTTFQITFDPSAPGLRSTTLSFTNNDSDKNPFSFSIQGTGIGTGIAVIGNGMNIADGDSSPDPADYTDFGGVNITGSTLVRTFTITNTGSLDLALGSVTIGGANAADFAVSAQPAATVAPNSNTTFQVTFDPSALGVRSATLSFTNNAGSANPFDFNIQGTGMASEIAVTGNGVNITNLDSTPDLADHTDFGNVNPAGSSLVRIFTITNAGTVDLTLGSVTVGGPHAADFTVSGQPVPTVPAHGATVLNVTFDPSAFGLRSATLSFTNNDSDENPFTFSIQGTGAGPEIAVSGNNVDIARNDVTPDLADYTDFGSVGISSTLVRTFSISNIGNINLALGNVTLSGQTAGFSVTAQPASAVVPNGSTTFQVSFNPSTTGGRIATVTFANNDSDENPFFFSIQATGVASSDANLSALTLSRGTLDPVFAAATANYSASVAYADTNLTVTATRAQAGATMQVRINGGSFTSLASGSPSAPLALNVGTNTVNVRVTAQDNATTKTYTVTVIRRAAGAGDLDPLNLAVAGSGVFASALQPDGKTIIAGIFTSVLGVARTNIARLNADGTLDMGFDPNANSEVDCVAVQKDGKVLLGGVFTTLRPNGAALATNRNYLARLNTDGTLDAGFDPNPNNGVRCFAIQSDGKIVVGGHFTTLQPNGGAVTNRNRIVRLNADGTLDTGFDPNADSPVQSVALQSDGKVLLGGQFTTLQPNGGAATNRSRLARVNADGTLDTGFDPNANNWVRCFAVQSDGKILVGGDFTTLQPNGGAVTNRNRIARLNADGTLDTGFDPKADNAVNCLALQADGKVLLGGIFGSLQPNGAPTLTSRLRIARVNPDGTLDTSFDPNANNAVYSVALQADGKVLLCGTFTALQPNGAGATTARTRFARLLNDPATQSLTAPSASAISWTRGDSSPEVFQVTFEVSTDAGANWTALGDGVRVGTTADWQLTGLALPASGHLRAQGRVTSGYNNGSFSLIESVTNFSVAVVVVPPVINPQSLKLLGNGAFQFSFSNADNIAFNVLAATNVSQPLSNWTVLGVATNLGGGLYQFTDTTATNFPRRSYRLRFP